MNFELSERDTAHLTDLFLTLGTIDNPSGAEEPMANAVTVLLENLELEAEVDSFFNVFAKGYVNDSEEEPIFLNAHLDGVQPCIGKRPVLEDGVFRSNGETILSGDDLSGVAAILFALRYIKDEGLKTKPFEVLFTSMEEIGGVGIKNFDFSKMTSHKGLVMDSLLPVGGIVAGAPSKHNFEIKVEGEGSHGSEAKDLKDSPIYVLSSIVGECNKIVFPEASKFNIGIFEGGTAVNSFPSSAIARGEFRCYSKDEEVVVQEGIREIVDRLSDENFNVEISFDEILVRSHYTHRKDSSLIEQVEEVFGQMEEDPERKISKGVSDANTLNARGKTAVLLGTGVKKAHTVDESLALSELVKLTEFLINFLVKK